MENSHTILELLIVIAMLGILYSMYVGAITNARRAADIAVCKHYQWEFRTLVEIGEFDVDRTMKVADRCYDCHATEP